MDRFQPIQFNFSSRCTRALIKIDRHNRSVRRLHGGPGGVFRALMKQMELTEPPLHWAICLKDFPKQQCEVAWVVNDPEDVNWAVRNRQRLKARYLWAGPNIVVVPQESNAVLTSPEIDRIIVPTRWVADVYSGERAELGPKIAVWPAAIDIEFWSPADTPKLHWIIYNKYQDALAAQIAKVLEAMNASFIQINYGQYTLGKYRDILRHARGMIWLSHSESQGLALLEALSMDIPALVWDPGDWIYRSPELKQEFTAPATSAPYFSEDCGLRFAAASEFASAFDKFSGKLNSYKPRQYILNSGLDLGTNKQSIISLIES